MHGVQKLKLCDFCQLNAACGPRIGLHSLSYLLGVTGSPKMDVFLENSQTAFDPPPLVFGNYIALFSRKSAKYA